LPTLPDVTFVTLRARENLSLGTMYLSASLRRCGARVRLVEAADRDELVRRFARAPTPVVGFSVTTGLHSHYLDWARWLKRHDASVHTVFGGPHATYFPELIREAGVDAVCIGEGEESFPEYLRALAGEGGPPDRPVAGFRHWRRGELLDGGLRPPVQGIDRLPAPDWELFFDHNPRLAHHPVKSFLASRGCPHRCTYCFNRTWNALHRGAGIRTVRLRDPRQVVDEILAVRRRWGARLIWFLDSNFAVSRGWLAELLPLYRAEVGLPFFCKVRPGSVGAEVIEALIDAGCTSVGLGIEAGDPELRNAVLERGVSDEEIVATSRAFHDRGALVMSFNMLGLPRETYAAARRTLSLNVRGRVDYAMTTFLQPFPGTEITRRAREQGLFDGDFDALDCSYFQPSPMRFGADAQDRQRIVNLQRLMALAVSFPAVRRRIDSLVALPENRFYLELFKAYNHHAFHRQFYRAYARRPM
jgi:radical SAM superfamily enzyme YgiQ (UPF0313 family)